ncbi:MAG: hypothetical protein ABI402_18410 [Ferruginibacter sp.]
MKTFLIMSCLVFNTYFSFAQNVVRAEYFIDTDNGFGNNHQVDFSSSPDNIFPFSIDLAGYLPGFHDLYIRVKDDQGKWSQTTSSRIEITTTSTNVIQAEYFLDTDLGFGNNHQILLPASPDNIFSLPVDLAGYEPGYHDLYIRTKDDQGKWSQTTTRRIEIEKAATQVISAEYFFNTDPGFGNAYQVPFTPLPDGTFSFNIPFDNIPDSVNTLYFRVKDSINKRWSQTQWLRDTVVTSLATDSIWSHVATWSNHKIPDSNTIVILRHIVYVDIMNAICRSLAAIGPALPAQPAEKLRVYQNMLLKITGH